MRYILPLLSLIFLAAPQAFAQNYPPLSNPENDPTLRTSRMPPPPPPKTPVAPVQHIYEGGVGGRANAISISRFESFRAKSIGGHAERKSVSIGTRISDKGNRDNSNLRNNGQGGVGNCRGQCSP